ncbi:MAG: VWA domain-containing protein [Planctomycetota bacterium]
MILGAPWFLLLLLPLACAVWRRLRQPPPALDGGSRHVLGGLPTTLRARTAWLPGLCALLAALLLVLALARPLKGREEARVLRQGIDILLVIDTSSSMLVDTLQRGTTDLEVVKSVVSEFVQGRTEDRIGLISFAAWPRTECPLTLDMPGLQARVAGVRAVQRQTEEDGTAIGVALGQAAAKLRDSAAKSRVIVLLTDGEENQFTIDPSEAAALCKDLGVRVYTIGAGRRLDGLGNEHQLSSLLQDIASSTGGRYFRAKEAEVLTQVYAEIDRLERTERQDVRYTDYVDLYPWLLLPAALLLALDFLTRRVTHLDLAT